MRLARVRGKPRERRYQVQRIALAILAVALAVALAACAGGGSGAPSRQSPLPDLPPSPAIPATIPAAIPASVLPDMTSVVVEPDAETIAEEAVHIDDLAAVLDDAGFVSASQRSFQGGSGAFSRVFVRTLVFESTEGVDAFLGWFRTKAGKEIITARRIDPAGLPPGAVAFRHVPGGCCRRDFPVFLASWPREASVVFVHGGGPRATTAALVELADAVDERIRDESGG